MCNFFINCIWLYILIRLISVVDYFATESGNNEDDGTDNPYKY